MTLGERIASERKKQKLSQEALGERLGVSRQAISKWEADGAIPEVDKLIALSRLFGVSVGWLLGVEEESADEQADPAPAVPEAEARELLEALSQHYTKEQEQERRRWRRGAILASGIGAAVLIVLIFAVAVTILNLNRQVDSLKGDYSALQGTVNGLYGQIAGIQSDVAEELQSQNYILSDWSITPGGTRQQVELNLQAMPRAYQEGDVGYFTIQTNEGSLEQGCEWNGTCFTACITMAPENDLHYGFVQQHADGTREVQSLSHGDWDALCDLQDALRYMRVMDAYCGEWTVETRTLTVEGTYTYYDEPILRLEGDHAQPTGVDWVVTCDGRETLRWTDEEVAFCLEETDFYSVESHLQRDLMLEQEGSYQLSACLEFDDGTVDEIPALWWVYRGEDLVELNEGVLPEEYRVTAHHEEHPEEHHEEEHEKHEEHHG